jgi:hypothetical protein
MGELGTVGEAWGETPMPLSGAVKVNSLTTFPEESGELEEPEELEFITGEIIGVFAIGWGVGTG